MAFQVNEHYVSRYPIVSRFSNYYRKKRMKRFIRSINVTESTCILDVGGLPYYWQGFPVPCKIVCLNLYDDETPGPPNVSMCLYNGKRFPFRDKGFDVVHSNSVIEHVGDFNAQRRFAAEIMRVGKKYWVQTPNFFFFFEPHAMFPLFQLFPPNLKLWVARNWPKVGYSAPDLLSTQLLTASQLRFLFPKCTIARERFIFLTKSLCASGPE